MTDRTEREEAPRTGASSGAADGPRPAVIAHGLAKSFGRHRALRDVSCRLPAGVITGVVGPDAAGKTTFLRLLAGLLKADAGSVEVLGRAPAGLIEQDPNSLGYMPQKFGLYEDLTVLANLRLHASLRGLDRERGEALFRRLLAFTGLAPFTGRLAGRLSGGMKQKLGIACALLGEPRVLLLDEPGVGVDPLSRRELWTMVGELAGRGMTIIWSTAYLDEAERCPHVLVLDEGTVLFEGSPEDFKRPMAGRVHLLPRGNGREAFLSCFRRKGVADVVVQGSSLRLVLAADAPADLVREVGEKGHPAEPRLEDAYMAALGGINQTPSPFERADGERQRTVRLTGPAMECEGLTKRYGSFTAAGNISFSVRPGEIFGLLGPNGAGKSTTFRMLCGLSRPTSGTCRVAGINMLEAGGAARANMGYMAQKFSLYPDIPVYANIRVYGTIYGLDRATLARRTDLLAEALDLKDHLSDITGTLSLGLKQRLALLCATLHDPAVLFLGEPTSGVDVRTRRDFWKHILALTSRGTSVLATTHLMDEAEYCDTMALIYQGHLVSLGSPDELKAGLRAERPDMEDPTLEDAFIAAIERDAARTRAAQGEDAS